MELSQKQIMLAKDKFLKKNNKLILIFFFLLIYFFSTSVYSISDLEKKRLNNYLKNLQNFSSEFLQISDDSQEGGTLYVGAKRIKLEYSVPVKLSLVINEKKGMYVNHDLREVQFFKTKDSLAELIFSLFKQEDFLKNFLIIKNKNKNTIEFNKNFINDDTFINLKIYFENSPMVLRSIEYRSENTYIGVSFFNHIYNLDLNEKFFSMAPPYQ